MSRVLQFYFKHGIMKGEKGDPRSWMYLISASAFQYENIALGFVHPFRERHSLLQELNLRQQMAQMFLNLRGTASEATQTCCN